METDLPNPQLARDCCQVLKQGLTFAEWVEKMEWLHEKYPGMGFDRVIADIMAVKEMAAKNRELWYKWRPERRGFKGNGVPF